MVAFTASGSLRLAIRASCFRFRILVAIVVSASPFFWLWIAKFMRSCVVSLSIEVVDRGEFSIFKDGFD
jgi:hypothetical protein